MRTSRTATTGADGKQRVKSIHDATMLGQQPAHVLHAEISLDKRLAKVTDGRCHDHYGTEQWPPATSFPTSSSGKRNRRSPITPKSIDPGKALPRFLGTDGR